MSMCANMSRSWCLLRTITPQAKYQNKWQFYSGAPPKINKDSPTPFFRPKLILSMYERIAHCYEVAEAAIKR